ncbi:MAG: dihydroorotase [Chloroflexi bacterium]|nr:dihydroorotase [Chloroflexota bacterium]
MTSWLIHGGRIIDPCRGIDRTGSLMVSDGRISWVGSEDDAERIAQSADCSVLSANGLVICSGFIDLHCHLREPGFEEKETIASGTKAAARGGFTTVCCMPNTDPPIDSPATIDFIRARAKKEGAVRVLPITCISRGRQGKELAPMGELASAGAIGFSDDGSPMLDPELMRRALELSRKLNLPIIDHCEDTVLTSGGVMNEGLISCALGLPGMPAIAEDKIVARDIKLAEETKGWIHIAHVSTTGSVELVRQAKKKGVHVTAEVTPHHLTLTEEKVKECGAMAKVNPPLRTDKDVQALIRGLKDGTIDIIATDHAPHTRANKEGEITGAAFGISNFETALGSLMRLVHDGQITLSALIAALTSEPAKMLRGKHGKLGTLAPGAEADIVILDPEKEWLVDTDKFASRGRNTPLAGNVLKGKVMATFCGGRLVYKDELIRVEETIHR